MRASRVLGLQPTRAVQMHTSQALRMQPSRALQMRASQMLKMRTSPSSLFQRTKAAMMPVPKEEHSAHTISQRIRTLKKMPVELVPLAFVLAVAIFFAGYSMIRKLFTDRTLRLSRSGGVSHKNEH